MGYVLRAGEDGQVTCSPRTSKTWKTCQRPKFASRGFKHQAVSEGGTLLFPCADGLLRVFDLPRPHRGERPAGRNLEEDEEEEEETSFQEMNGKDVWSMSGDIQYSGTTMYIHQNLHVPNAESFTIPIKYVDVMRQTRTSIHNPSKRTLND